MKKHITPALLMPLIALAAFLLPTPGCSTLQQSGYITPTRIEAVTKLGVYISVYGLAKDPGKLPALRAAQATLNRLVSNEQWDMHALLDAVVNGGFGNIVSEEGSIIVGEVPMFWDAFIGVSIDLRQQDYVRAVILGASAGLNLALATKDEELPAGRIAHHERTLADLRAEAVSARPAKRAK